MTTWLEFRSEPLSNVPEVEFYAVTVTAEKVLGPNPEWFEGVEVNLIKVKCAGDECNFEDYATEPDEAEDLKSSHQRWHEDGMPE